MKLKDGMEIANYGNPYIIAEVNSSHNGNVELAKKMIDEIKAAGCNCVKFQSWTSDTLYSASYYRENPIAKRIINKFSMEENQLAELSKYCEGMGLAFSSTPYSINEVDFLVEQCNVPFVKIASMEINNLEFIKYIARTGIPAILSTGMADIKEIEEAVETFVSTGNTNLCLLHCVSIYPVKPEEVRLNNILGLRQQFPDYPIGFSDHTEGIECACAAVALGAGVIEKHFTLDKTKMGMDNNMAIEPDEMRLLVHSCRNVYESMGTTVRIVSEQEKEQRVKMRRSIVTKAAMDAGTVICLDNVELKRPGSGLEPKRLNEIIGRKLRYDVEEGTVLKEDMLE